MSTPTYPPSPGFRRTARRCLVPLLAVALALPGAAARGTAGYDLHFAAYQGGARSGPYRDGQRALDEGNWKAAATAFRRAAAERGDDADAALYWLAYALHKDGRQADALATLRELRADHPASGWLDDAQALELEMRGPQAAVATGGAAESEELKLLALNGLLQMEPSRALPMLRKLLQGDASPRLKKQALFVLGQSGTPEARQLLVDVAHGRAHPALQVEAIEMLGIAGGRQSVAALGEIYRQATDRRVKRAVLNAYLICSAAEELVAVAQSDPDMSLRREAISKLGPVGAQKQLRDLYARETSPELRRDLLQAMGVASDVEGLAQVARSERDPGLRNTAIRSIGIAGGSAAGAALEQMYLGSSDGAVRDAVIEALFIQGNARVLVELFRRDPDPLRRREIVQKLSLMSSPEATELLMKLLDQ